MVQLLVVRLSIQLKIQLIWIPIYLILQKNYPKLKIVVIKYNAGNVRSVENAINRLNLTCSITDDPEIIKSADKVIFPGVGHAVPTMKYLKERKLDKVIKELKQPILGICLGQQLMCAHSEEGDVDCLNIFPIMVKNLR